MEMIRGSLIVKGNREAGKAQSLYHVLLRAVFLESSILLKEEGTPLFDQIWILTAEYLLNFESLTNSLKGENTRTHLNHLTELLDFHR